MHAPTSDNRRHADRNTYSKENVEEYTIGNEKIVANFFEGYKNLKKINICDDLKIDACDDSYTRFGFFTPNLEQFHVISPESPFFAEDGVLYMNMDKARQKEKEQWTDNFFLCSSEVPDKLHGNMLVAMPPKYKSKSFEIPDFVEVIGCSAFCGSNLEKLTIPRSVRYIGMGGLGEMEYLKELRVPNQPIYVYWDHNCIGHDLDILCSDAGEVLTSSIRDFWWNLLVNDKYDKEVLAPLMAELGIQDEMGYNCDPDNPPF